MKIFRDLKQNKKSIIIWGLLILAICAMFQNGASATAMAFNGRHFDFFSVNLDAQGSVRSGSQNFDWGYQYRGDGFGDDGGQRYPVFTKDVPASHDLVDGQLGGWDGDFDVVHMPRRSSHDRDDDKDNGPRKNFRIWDLPKWDDQGLDDEWFDFTGEFDGCFNQSVCEGDGDGDNNPVSTPEPTTLLLLGGGLLGLAGFKKRHF